MGHRILFFDAHSAPFRRHSPFLSFAFPIPGRPLPREADALLVCGSGHREIRQHTSPSLIFLPGSFRAHIRARTCVGAGVLQEIVVGPGKIKTIAAGQSPRRAATIEVQR